MTRLSSGLEAVVLAQEDKVEDPRLRLKPVENNLAINLRTVILTTLVHAISMHVLIPGTIAAHHRSWLQHLCLV